MTYHSAAPRMATMKGLTISSADKDEKQHKFLYKSCILLGITGRITYKNCSASWTKIKHISVLTIKTFMMLNALLKYWLGGKH
jgi:hypothetical protein